MRRRKRPAHFIGARTGVNTTEMMAAIKVQIDQTLFPNGAKSGWWMKTVQLVAEARDKSSVSLKPALVGMNLPV